MDDIVNLLQKLNTHTSNLIRVCMPARIESYDFKTQQASVKLDMKELYNNGSEIDYPVVSGVPVVFMASGGAAITMPVNRGDYCLVLFADRDIGNWLLGGSGQKPDSTRMHNLSDAIAIMGLMPFTKTSSAENNTDVLINYSGSKIRLKKDGQIDIETTKTINIKSTEIVNIESKDIILSTTNDITVKATNALNIDSKNITLTATENITAKCVDAIVTASNQIKTTAVKFVHTGDMSISGNLELVGNGSGANGGAIVFSGGITNTGDIKNTGSIINTGGTIKSNAVTLDTHTHTYTAPVAGSSPTAVVPSTTGTPI